MKFRRVDLNAVLYCCKPEHRLFQDEEIAKSMMDQKSWSKMLNNPQYLFTEKERSILKYIIESKNDKLSNILADWIHPKYQNFGVNTMLALLCYAIQNKDQQFQNILFPKFCKKLDFLVQYNAYDTIKYLKSQYDCVDNVAKAQQAAVEFVLDRKNIDNASLHEAAREWQPEIVKFLLLQQNINVNSQDSKGNTVLHLLYWCEDVELINTVLARVENVNLQNHYGRTPLYKAIQYNNVQMLECLLKDGRCIDNYLADIFWDIVDNKIMVLYELDLSDKDKIVEIFQKYAQKLIELAQWCIDAKNDETTLAPLPYKQLVQYEKLKDKSSFHNVLAKMYAEISATDVKDYSTLEEREQYIQKQVHCMITWLNNYISKNFLEIQCISKKELGDFKVLGSDVPQHIFSFVKLSDIHHNNSDHAAQLLGEEQVDNN